MVSKDIFTTSKYLELFILIHIQDRFIKYFLQSGRSSGVERNLAKYSTHLITNNNRP